MKRLGSKLVIATGGLLLAVATAPPAAAQVSAMGKVCGGIAVTSPDKPKVRDRFSASKTLDLSFRMRLRNLDDDRHLVSFRVYTPKGHLYQELQVVHAAEPNVRFSNVTARIPVGGTAISTSSLYGRWKVVPHFDGGAKACAAGAAFTIVQ